MHTVILHMTALIACGVFWRLIRPGGLDADATRNVLTSLVYYLLLPALVIQVLWKAPLGLSSLGIAAGAAAGPASGAGVDSAAADGAAASSPSGASPSGAAASSSSTTISSAPSAASVSASASSSTRWSASRPFTPVSFTNEYNWGYFNVNPDKLMQRYFDSHPGCIRP